MNSLNIVLKLIIVLAAVNTMQFAEASELRVRMRVKETKAVITKLKPNLISSDLKKNFGVGKLQADSTFLFKKAPEEGKYIVMYEVDEICYAEEIILPHEKIFDVLVPQSVLSESSGAEQLAELKVEGASQYTEGNKTTFIPTKKEKKISSGGIELLRTMALASLYVDPMTNTVTTAAGDGVKLFIDMQPATQSEVEMLRAMDIQTIEYLESPSDPRFQGARYVVNYVLVKYEYGGYTVLSGQQRFIQDLGNYRVYSRLSSGRMLYDFGGGFGYQKDTKMGSDNLGIYNFPDIRLERRIVSDNAAKSSRNGYGTFRAVYQTEKANIANTLSLSGANRPYTRSDGHVSYTPEIYPDEESRSNSHSSDLSAVWNGNYFFSLPSGFSLNLTPSASYSKYRNASEYTERTTVWNDSHDKSWEYNFLAHLQKKLGAQSIGLRASTNGSGNSVTYFGTIPSKAHGSRYGGAVDLSANLSLGKFWGYVNVGTQFYSQTVSGITYKTVSPSYYMQAGYNFTKQNGISVYSTYSPYIVPIGTKSDNFIITDNLNGIRGNTSLSDGNYFNIGLQYKYRPSSNISIAAFWKFARMGNMIVDKYEPELYQGMPMMVRTWVNHGFMNSHDYGVNLSFNCLNSSLRLNGGISGQTVARHSLLDYSGTRLRFVGQAMYIFGQFYVLAAYNYHRTEVSNTMISKIPPYYSITAGWGNGNWNISMAAFNPSVSDYKAGSSIITTPDYSSWSQSYSSSYHRLFVLNVTYSFSYGKKVQRGDQIEPLQGGASGILDYSGR